jgi:hypothetical protein
VILSSASSKTAFGLAFLLAQRKQVEVVGLTSKSNADFVGKLGCYDRVATYDQIASLPKQPAASSTWPATARSCTLHHYSAT